MHRRRDCGACLLRSLLSGDSPYGMSPPATEKAKFDAQECGDKCRLADVSVHELALQLGRSLAADDVFGMTEV